MRKRIALTLAGAGLCLAVLAPPAAAVPRELFGIAAGGQPTSNGDAQRMNSAGVRTFRMVIDWREVQPTRNGPLRLGGVDARVERFAENGIRPVPLIYGSPSWVASRPNRPPLGSASKQRAWKSLLTR
ncbi:MAG TPA: hypothetical protein VLA62_03370, partial [Solirubrobacterales bacterium]|nr:hypothetical protein [Solirubrobacterales bacterium]